METKTRKKTQIQADCEGDISTLIWIFISQLSEIDFTLMNIGCCCNVLLLKFCRPSTNAIFVLLDSAMSLPSPNVNIQAKSHFAILQVLLFLRSTFYFQFHCSEYRTVRRTTKRCSICMHQNLSNFEYPSKIRLCS